MSGESSSEENMSSSDSEDDYVILDRIRARKIYTLEAVVVPFSAFVREMQHVCRETHRVQLSAEYLRYVYNKYQHGPTSRSWDAVELHQCYQMLRELGFVLDAPIDLNSMLPATVRNRDGSMVEAASIFVWKQCGAQLGIQMDRLYETLEATTVDTVKWSRRARKGSNGFQHKRARHNACYTDLLETVVDPDPGDITEAFVRHKHPKNDRIKFTNFRFKGELQKFRTRFAAILGPFGYKFNQQYAELNKYYAQTCGIGWHGDTERDSVNCLKVGRSIPLCFSWFHKTRPVGQMPSSNGVVVTWKKKKNCSSSVTSAVSSILLGHGDVYMMSHKSLGKDWRSHDPALRHSAGHPKYTQLPTHPIETGHGSAYSLTFSDVVENDSETPELRFSTPYAGYHS